MTPDFSKLSLTELKAAVYDQMAAIEQSQQSIRLLSEEIAKLLKEEAVQKE